MMEATLIGESSRMERLWTDHFRRTGTYHMLVIDGLHITLLAAFLLFLLRLCFLPEIAALAVTACGAWLYALGFRMERARHSCRGRFHAVRHSALLLSARPPAQFAGSCRHCLFDLRPQPALRSRLSIVVPVRGRYRASGRAAPGCLVDAVCTRLSRNHPAQPRPTPSAPRRSVPFRAAAVGRDRQLLYPAPRGLVGA